MVNRKFFCKMLPWFPVHDKDLTTAYIFNIFLLFVEGFTVEMNDTCPVDGFAQTTPTSKPVII